MKLFKFAYSPYARKVQAVLDLAGIAYEAIEVPYGDRSELIAVTGGYLQVPVLVNDAGKVITESRSICQELLSGPVAALLTPSPLEGPIWAYADFCDGPLEDVLFRIATPDLVRLKETAQERALFVYIKERKFGSGCVERWARERESLLAQGRALIEPSLRTLEQQPFLFGQNPTLADAALYGNLALLLAADPRLLDALGRGLTAFVRRMDERTARSSAARSGR